MEIEKKKISVSNVYYALRQEFGSKVAEEIMDSVEGHEDEYQEIVKLVELNRLKELVI